MPYSDAVERDAWAMGHVRSSLGAKNRSLFGDDPIFPPPPPFNGAIVIVVYDHSVHAYDILGIRERTPHSDGWEPWDGAGVNEPLALDMRHGRATRLFLHHTGLMIRAMAQQGIDASVHMWDVRNLIREEGHVWPGSLIPQGTTWPRDLMQEQQFNRRNPERLSIAEEWSTEQEIPVRVPHFSSWTHCLALWQSVLGRAGVETPTQIWLIRSDHRGGGRYWGPGFQNQVTQTTTLDGSEDRWVHDYDRADMTEPGFLQPDENGHSWLLSVGEQFPETPVYSYDISVVFGTRGPFSRTDDYWDGFIGSPPSTTNEHIHSLYPGMIQGADNGVYTSMMHRNDRNRPYWLWVVFQYLHWRWIQAELEAGRRIYFDPIVDAN